MIGDYSQPSITLFNIRIDEPVITLTDLFISAVCFYAFFRLNAISAKNKMHFYLKIYFISMGFATFIGGVVGHGFLYAFSYSNTDLPVSPWKLPGWLTSMVSIAMVERASIEYAKNLIKPSTGKFLSILNMVELFTFVFITFITLNFFYVEVHTAYGLLIVVAGLNLFVFFKTRSTGSKLFLVAVGISAVSAIVFMNKWGLSPWFTHFDVSHVLLTIAAWFFYKASMNCIKEG